MNTTHLDGEALKEIFYAGYLNLKLHKKEIDLLNVFPVPDGDTGTNMVMTLEGGTEIIGDIYCDRISDFLKTYAKGVLLSARGNSGVILSQFIKGVSIGAENLKTIGIENFKKAFKHGVEKAYESVITPTEGTMLTVMREGYEAVEKESFETFEELLEKLVDAMLVSLANTPNLLPVLKEAGVIDSGAAGFVYIFEGVMKAIKGEKIDVNFDIEKEMKKASAPKVDFSAFNADSELEFGYCTEFILQLQNKKVDIENFDISEIIDYLNEVGNSIVAVKDDDLVKVHVHTFKPGDVLNFGQKFGEYISLKIENMALQHNETEMFKEAEEKKKAHKATAIIACVAGDGLKEYFKSIGVDVIVEGGQSDNPSTEDFLKAFDEVDADTIIVLPNNSNIIMAANQAAEQYMESDGFSDVMIDAEGFDFPGKSRIVVVETKSLAEGYSAMSMIDSSQDADSIIGDMKAAIADTATGLITTAVRDVEYENLSVKEGDYIGLDRKNVLSDSPDIIEAVRGLLKNTEGIEDKVVIACFYGKNVDDALLKKIEDLIVSEFGWLEYGFINGGQEVYDFIFAID